MKTPKSLHAEHHDERHGDDERKEMKRAMRRMQDGFETLFGAMMGGTYARSDEDACSGDAATIFVLVSQKNEQGKDAPVLVKVGWGEFSKQTFEGEKYPTFKHFPYDIYCVPQLESYFADEKLRQQMSEDPVAYLEENSILAAREGKVQVAQKLGYRQRRLERNIQPVAYDEMLRTVRNQIIQEHTTPEEFAAFLKELPDEPNELAAYMSAIYATKSLGRRELEHADEQTKQAAKKKHLMRLMWGMGVETVGIAVGDRAAMESVLTLKQQFDVSKNSF